MRAILINFIICGFNKMGLFEALALSPLYDSLLYTYFNSCMNLAAGKTPLEKQEYM
jgi:hypothetical protein